MPEQQFDGATPVKGYTLFRGKDGKNFYLKGENLSDSEIATHVAAVRGQLSPTPESQAPNALAQAQAQFPKPGTGQGPGAPIIPSTFGERLRDAGNPGSFEGHPENIGQYVPQSFGQMMHSIIEFSKGNFAKSGHELISGAGNALLPVAPFVVAGAPAAAALGTAGGMAGGYAAKSGAKALGANEDQTQLAEDFGNLLGGYLGGVTTPKIKAGIAKAAYNPDGTLTPLADAALHPTKLPETAFRKIFEEPPSYPGGQLPSAEEFYANKAADLMKRQLAQNIVDRQSASALKAERTIREVAAKNNYDFGPGTTPTNAPVGNAQLPSPPASPAAQPNVEMVGKLGPPQKRLIVDPNSVPPPVQRTFQSIAGEDLLPMVVKGDRGAILEWQRRGLRLPEGVGFMVEGGTTSRAYPKR